MRHFEKLLNVPMQDNSADAHLFDVHLPDLPSAAALNTTISPDEVSDAIKALKSNKASDLYGMRSEFIIDAASMMLLPSPLCLTPCLTQIFLLLIPLDAL